MAAPTTVWRQGARHPPSWRLAAACSAHDYRSPSTPRPTHVPVVGSAHWRRPWSPRRLEWRRSSPARPRGDADRHVSPFACLIFTTVVLPKASGKTRTRVPIGRARSRRLGTHVAWAESTGQPREESLLSPEAPSPIRPHGGHPQRGRRPRYTGISPALCPRLGGMHVAWRRMHHRVVRRSSGCRMVRVARHVAVGHVARHGPPRGRVLA